MNTLCNMLLCGKRNTGKTILGVDIISIICRQGIEIGLPMRIDDPKKLLKRVVVMSGTERYNKIYQRRLKVKGVYISEGFDTDFLEAVVGHCEKSAHIHGGNIPSKGTLIVLEDLAFNKRFYEHPLIKKIIFNGRWLNIALMILVQEPMKFPKEYRSNLDYCFTTREFSPQQQKNLLDYYFGAGGFTSVKEFNECMHTYSMGNNVIVMDYTQKRVNKISDCVFYYHAEYILNGKILKRSHPKHPEYNDYIKEKQIEKALRAKKIDEDEEDDAGDYDDDDISNSGRSSSGSSEHDNSGGEETGEYPMITSFKHVYVKKELPQKRKRDLIVSNNDKNCDNYWDGDEIFSIGSYGSKSNSGSESEHGSDGYDDGYVNPFKKYKRSNIYRTESNGRNRNTNEFNVSNDKQSDKSDDDKNQTRDEIDKQPHKDENKNEKDEEKEEEEYFDNGLPTFLIGGY